MVLDTRGDGCTVPSVEAFISGRVAFEVDVADATGLDPQLGPHGGPVRVGERLGQRKMVKQWSSAGRYKRWWYEWFGHEGSFLERD